jgi:hypothetical protein
MSGLRPGPGVAVIEDDDGAVYIASLPEGPIHVLDGVAAVIWAVARGTDRARIAQEVAEVTAADLGEVRVEVEAFIDDLITRGLLEADRD